MPVGVLAAAISLQRSYTLGEEPDAWAVMVYSHWAGLHNVGDEWVEEIMSAHMTREPDDAIAAPSWYPGLWARPSRRGGARRR